ncbi:hypothetical protein DFS33DRAFT_1274580 [Desarmillaria ectypa]|nr:hypothetical protein DFS33DRAFT_1274580 [Desarmillaria ectypa]
MPQNSQNPSNSAKLREVVTTIATSTSPGTAVNMVALAVVLWYAFPNFFAPLQPSSAINSLEDAIGEVADMYGVHKGILHDGESLKVDLKRLELAVLELKEGRIQDSLNISWTRLPERLSHAKHAWSTARAHRREVEISTIQAKKSPLQRALKNQGAVNDQREDQATRLANGASVV